MISSVTNITDVGGSVPVNVTIVGPVGSRTFFTDAVGAGAALPAVIPAVIPGGGAVASLAGRRSVSVEGRGALVPTAVLLVGSLAVSALVAAAVVVPAAVVGRV